MSGKVFICTHLPGEDITIAGRTESGNPAYLARVYNWGILGQRDNPQAVELAQKIVDALNA